MAELTIDQALQKGIAAHKAGQVQEADRLYTAILKAQPKHPDANHNMGVLAVGVDKVQEALPFLKTALETNPSTAQFWLSYIDALIKLDRLADAQALFDQAKSNGVKDDGFDVLERRLNVPSGVPVEAVVGSQEIEQVQPNILDSLKLDQAIKLAKTNVKEGSPEEAKRIYQDVLVKFPKNKRAIGGLKGLAGVLVGKASKIPDPPQDQVQLIINLYNQQQLQQALQQAELLMQRFPNSSVLYNIIGAVYKGLGHLDDSVKAYTKALSLKPDYPEANSNMGIARKDQGKLEEAIEAFKKALAIKPDFAEAYNNMGNVLKDQGKLKEAIEAYNKAIAIKPDYPDVYNNMGITLREQGNLEEAIEAYNKALALKPHNAAAVYNNMGNALEEQGKLEEAIEAYNKALTLKPDYAEVYNNMGNVLQAQGKLEETIESYNKALIIKPDYAEAYNNMGNALKGVVFTKPSPSLEKIIITILDHKTYVRPKDISTAAISLLKFEPTLQKVLRQNFKGQPIQFLNDDVVNLSELPLLLKLMAVCPLADLALESILRDIRSSLLSSISELDGSSEVLRFQSALALQCFTNEYVYSHSVREGKTLEALQVSVERLLSDGKQPSSQSILCLASYKALHEYDWWNSLDTNSGIEEVYTRQVMEPQREGHLKSTIPVLEKITDAVSEKVREQYEESPYPRWVNLGLRLKPATTSKVISEGKLRLFDDKIKNVDAPNILVAGCGTGQHSIGTATRFKNSKVLAVDLSLSSLAYAKRKTEELGIKNIDYLQADILDLSKLERQFDIVESAGVLHHMDDPMAGWRVLTDCLKPGGLMKIGLYSELARQHVVKMKQEISKAGIGSSNEEMRSFRTMVMKSDQNHHKEILRFIDFYSLSELKDLLFHVQEHRFTIPQIQDCLSELGLKFCGFETAKIVSHFKLTNTDAEDPYNLDKWQTYEEANSKAFAEMYQFWCQKVA